MLSFPAAIRVYLCMVPCGMRRSFDGLSMMAEQIIGCHPFSGHLLVFSNRRTDRLKILYWDLHQPRITDSSRTMPNSVGRKLALTGSWSGNSAYGPGLYLTPAHYAQWVARAAP